MSDSASYGFLSVLRRGVVALLAAKPPAAATRLGVALSLSVGGAPVPAPPTVMLRGPGDVTGFDPAAVRRTWPAAGADNAEPNYLALVEFGEADLPWRYTPDTTSDDRLAPWLTLVVAEASEIGLSVAASRARPLAAVTLSGSALPPLDQAWAWAHAQVLGPPDGAATDFTPSAIATLLSQDPARLSARLLSPRRLQPLTGYRAFVVPSFERGRLAGLGQVASGVDRLAPAWTPNQASATLPVYHEWSFRTGEAGDFGALVAKLQPVGDVPSAVWRRAVAFSPPGAEPAQWQVADLEGVLIPVGASSLEWNAIDAHGFTSALAARINAEATKLEPPLYGRWLAAAAGLSTSPTARPRWLHQLNADPRRRIAAGLGTTVVQAEQQELLAGAWAQVDGIRAANEKLRLAQWSRELALRLYTRHFSAVGGDAFLQLSAPLHARVRVGATTVDARLAASPIADGALAPAFRRVARPLGALGVRQGRSTAPTAARTALTRMNSGQLSVMPPPPAASAAGAVSRLGDLGAVFRKGNTIPEKLHAVTPPHGFALGLLTTTHAGTQPLTPAAPPPLVASNAPPAPPASAPPVGPAGPPVHPHPLDPAAMAVAADGFRQAATALMAQLALVPAPGVQWIAADLGQVRSTLLDRLHPLETIEAPLKDKLGDFAGGPRRTDPIEPVLAAPEFAQPMYRPLTALGREWLLPGLDQMPNDSVALFLTNWRFVESYLVGLNHEMARKLLWNGYPTDQRGTYFRRFWDAAGAGEGDIGPIHAWNQALGQNQARSGDPLVLLVRGELIRRYPNVMVYAAAAEVDATGRHPGATEKQPIFFGRVQPDVALFGFDLDREVARASPGWFFVLQEHPAEPRFGLATPGARYGEQPATWQALGWDHLAASEHDLANLRYIDLAATLPRDPASADAAGAVWHADGPVPSRSADLAHITFREPKRFAVHGSVLIHPLPPVPSPATPP